MRFKSITSVLFFTLISVLCATYAQAAAQVFPPVVLVTNDGAWRTNVLLHNTTGATITQRVGSLTYRNGSKTTVINEDYVLQPGEYVIFDDLGAHFDAGDRLLSIAPGLNSRQWFYFLPAAASCRPAFELPMWTSALAQTGAGLNYDDLRIDDVIGFGAFPTFFNTNTAAVTITALTFLPDGTAGEQFTIPPGLSQVRLHVQLPAGGRVAIYLGSPGGGNGTIAPVYVFVANGPADGGTQAIRLGS